MVTLWDPPRGVFIDYGHATFAETATNHHKGTIEYLALESLALKDPERSLVPHRRPCDLWSLGLVFYQLRFWKTYFWKGQCH